MAIPEDRDYIIDDADQPDIAREDIVLLDGSIEGPGAGDVVFENDKVKIWDITLQPGERSALHTHMNDYVLVQISGDKAGDEPHPETLGAYKDVLVIDIEPGDQCFIKKGGTETAFNPGKKPWRELCIELKDS